MKKRDPAQANQLTCQVPAAAHDRGAEVVPAWARPSAFGGNGTQSANAGLATRATWPHSSDQFEPSISRQAEGVRPSVLDKTTPQSVKTPRTSTHHKSANITPAPAVPHSHERAESSRDVSEWDSNSAQSPKSSSYFLLTIAESSRLLTVSEKTVRRLIERGDLAAVRIGRSVRIRPEVLAAYIDGRGA